MRTLLICLCLLTASVCVAADYQAEIVTPKQLVGFGYEPEIHTRYHAECGPGFSFEDVTTAKGIREPNLMIAKIVCDNETLNKIKEDGYTILWTQRIPDKTEIGTPTEPVKPLPKQSKEELDKLKAELLVKGVPSADLAKTAMQDTATADVTAQDVAVQLRDIMRDFPAKAK
jgi:hypothetical protein